MTQRKVTNSKLSVNRRRTRVRSFVDRDDAGAITNDRLHFGILHGSIPELAELCVELRRCPLDATGHCRHLGRRSALAFLLRLGTDLWRLCSALGHVGSLGEFKKQADFFQTQKSDHLLPCFSQTPADELCVRPAACSRRAKKGCCCMERPSHDRKAGASRTDYATLWLHAAAAAFRT